MPPNRTVDEEHKDPSQADPEPLRRFQSLSYQGESDVEMASLSDGRDSEAEDLLGLAEHGPGHAFFGVVVSTPKWLPERRAALDAAKARRPIVLGGRRPVPAIIPLMSSQPAPLSSPSNKLANPSVGGTGAQAVPLPGFSIDEDGACARLFPRDDD
ncbi:hypothetical protein C8Q76DRAFT_788957 [Earliella scabrosa]|nr:hypothetical protein C8Q76DRAFT_788957 [Earliella scabrosa]